MRNQNNGIKDFVFEFLLVLLWVVLMFFFIDYCSGIRNDYTGGASGGFLVLSYYLTFGRLNQKIDRLRDEIRSK
jgi:hypothetical protein